MQSSASNIENPAVALAPSDQLKGEVVNGDLAGILDTLDLPIIIVGLDCKVVRFNEAARDAVAFRPSDIGRLPFSVGLLSELKDLQQLSQEVIAHGTPCQREGRSGDRWFQLRIAPYGRNGRQVEGAVLTFTNVTAFRASVAQAIYEREYTKTILNTVAPPLVVVDRALGVQTGNRAFYAMFGIPREATQGRPLCNLGNHNWNVLSLWAS